MRVIHFLPMTDYLFAMDTFRFYISAAPDLRFERDLLARAIAEIPTTLGWTITQTPPASREPDLEAVRLAHAHVLMLGSDIQAPVGLEWAVARRAGKPVTMLYKSSVVQTQAAQAFAREVSKHGQWRAFEDAAGLRRLVLKLLADVLMSNAIEYEMLPDEIDRLNAWRKTLDEKQQRAESDARAGADADAIILTTERFVPSEGKLLRPE
jgi:hypothetical protein